MLLNFVSRKVLTHQYERVLTFDGAPVYVNDLNQNLSGSPDNPIGELISENPLDLGSSGLGTNIWFFGMGEMMWLH